MTQLTPHTLEHLLRAGLYSIFFRQWLQTLLILFCKDKHFTLLTQHLGMGKHFVYVTEAELVPSNVVFTSHVLILFISSASVCLTHTRCTTGIGLLIHSLKQRFLTQIAASQGACLAQLANVGVSFSVGFLGVVVSEPLN